jgi:Glycosyltransferase like family
MFSPMIAFGCSLTSPEFYDEYARPGIELASEHDSVVMAHQGTGSLMRNYNLLLDKAAKHDDLEALVLLHQDAEITDPDFCTKAREALADPDVALVGSAGAIGVRSIAWWEGAVTWASFTHRYPEWGGGEFAATTWVDEDAPSFAETGEVDAIDGFVMVLSPWAVRNLRFDESLGKIHGYDFDYCAQVRYAKRKVVTADLKVIHHHDLDLIRDVDVWIEAHIKIAEKWEGKLPGVGAGGGDWKTRARRAEAEAAAQRVEAHSAKLHLEALHRCYADLLRERGELTDSASWRMTQPLRNLKLALTHRRNGGRSGV